MNRYSDYDAFAWLYDQEWAHFGENIFSALKEIAKEKLPDKAKVLDLCCGTGQLARVLTEKGYLVTGIDGSAEMLRYARTNAPQAEFILDDARTFQLPSVYNAVFSTFDALNHIMAIEELLAVFKNVNGCLADGGIFIFDLNMEKTFETQWKAFNQIKEKPDYFYTIRGDYNKENKTGGYYCTIFRRQAKGWKRIDIKLFEKYYPDAEVKLALKKAGFTNIQTYTAVRGQGLMKVTDDALRIFYCARKP